MTQSIQWIAFKTLVTREWVRMVRIWTQTFLPPVITVTLYFTIFGQLIGTQIQSIHGFTYMQFIAPGLMMMMLIQGAYGNVSSSFFGQRFQNSIEEMLVSPMHPSVMMMGFLTGGLMRGLGIGCLICLVALFFTKLHIAHPLFMLSTAFLTALLFSLAGFTNGLFAKKFDDVAIIPTFILTPLTYLGGVFYSIQALPEIWQTISLFNPILYIVNAFRYSLLGYADLSIQSCFMVLISSTIALCILNGLLMKKGVGLRH